MENGDKVVDRLNWCDYLSPRFKVKPCASGNWLTCGTPILSMITGLDSVAIEEECPNVFKGWSTNHAKRFLKSKGYTVIPVTKNAVTSVDYWEDCPLCEQHVLMINAEVDSMDASWFLLHRGKLWHNDYLEERFNSLFFLNKPTQRVLMVWHPSWAPKLKKESYFASY